MSNLASSRFKTPLVLHIKNSTKLRAEFRIITFYVVKGCAVNFIGGLVDLTAASFRESQKYFDVKLFRTKAFTDSVKKSDFCTILFDESLNEYTVLSNVFGYQVLV